MKAAQNKRKKEGLESVVKTALFCRVSTKSQKIDGQIQILKEFATRRGFSNTITLQAKESGVKKQRESVKELIRLAKLGEINRVVLEDISRLTREGATACGQIVKELNSCGVEVVTMKEGLTLDGGWMSEMFCSIVASFARMDYEMRREKQARGIKSAQDKNGGVVPWNKKGKGRKVDEKKRSLIIKMSKAGATYKEIQSATGVSPTTISKSLRSK